MRLKRILAIGLVLTLLFVGCIIPVSAAEIPSNSAVDNASSATIQESTINGTVGPMVAYTKVWDRIEINNKYMERRHYRLGSCQFRNGFVNDMIGTYTQSYTVSLSASLSAEVSYKSEAKAAVYSQALTVSATATFGATVSAGQTVSTSTTVHPGQTVTFTAYMAGVCVDGTSVYKCYFEGMYEGEITVPASGNWFVSPTDFTVDAS